MENRDQAYVSVFVVLLFFSKQNEVQADVINNFCVVQKGVFYRSAQLSPKKLSFYIKKYTIKTVVNLRGEYPLANWWKKEMAVIRNNNVCFFNVPMTASKLTSKKNIRTILHIFDTAPRPILVHCQGGADRTGEVSALWVLDQQHKSTKVALRQLSIWHRYNRFIHPEKAFFVKRWKGRTWFEQEYDPAHFSKFKAQEE
jgi:undecaprenyl-diphosphatase